jgi:glycosyltransferase involved in cell wall biosynthesis
MISICMPTYNGERFITEAFASINAQDYRNFEVIISDDASKDNTLELCKAFQSKADYPVHIYSHTPNGIGANWNNCIMQAKGNYIKFLFQDDVLMPNSLSAQLAVLESTGAMATCAKRIIIDENSNIIDSGDWYQHFGDLQKDLFLPANEVYSFTKKDLSQIKVPCHNYFGEPDTFMFRVALFDKIGYFHTDYKQILDVEFAYRILKKYAIILDNRALLKFRVHQNQASSRNANLALDEHTLLHKQVLKNYLKYLPNNLQKEYYLYTYPLLHTIVKWKVKLNQMFK